VQFVSRDPPKLSLRDIQGGLLPGEALRTMPSKNWALQHSSGYPADLDEASHEIANIYRLTAGDVDDRWRGLMTHGEEDGGRHIAHIHEIAVGVQRAGLHQWVWKVPMTEQLNADPAEHTAHGAHGSDGVEDPEHGSSDHSLEDGLQYGTGRGELGPPVGAGWRAPRQFCDCGSLGLGSVLCRGPDLD
jgi:hypothetical protein